MIALTKAQMMLLHKMIHERYGGALGVLDEGILDSALRVPFATYAGEELIPEDKEKIVRLAYGLIMNHPFRDGNKRIGALVLLVLLDMNGFHIKATNAELAEIIMGIAAGEKDADDLQRWVTEKCA